MFFRKTKFSVVQFFFLSNKIIYLQKNVLIPFEKILLCEKKKTPFVTETSKVINKAD